ncbi:MAG: sulfite exporter TauE/SafE family protein [Dehalococcoidia bacterium]|nr:sulfite exporter TauE/SafE family protein [Dehalococcoidia bacterium]
MHPIDLWLIPLGVAVGAFGTLVGAGGGFLLVPVLLLLYPEREPETVTAMSLLVVCANATSGTLAYAHQRRVDYASGVWFAVATLPGAIGGAILVGYTPRRTFDALFAAALIGLGTWIVLRSRQQAIHPPVTGRGVVHRLITDREGHTFAYSFELWKGLALSTVVGFVSSLLGIGGGIVHVPVMATVLHFPVHIAAATSHFVLAFMSAEGTAVHAVTGALSWDRALLQAALIGAGAVPGAQIGARLSRRLHGTGIIRALAGALMLVGGRLALKAAGI